MITDTTDRKEALEQGLEMLGEVFARDLTDNLLLGYFFALKDLSIEQIRKAIFRALQESKSFPTPASLIELSGYATLPRRAMIAWGDALKAVSRHGCYRNVDFADKIINAVIRELGGWLTFITLFTSAREEEFLRMKFVKIYEHLSGFLDTSSPLCDFLPGMSTVDPPIIHTIPSSIPAGSLTHSERTALPQPTNPTLSLVDGLEGEAA
jgi:hypothetical protein